MGKLLKALLGEGPLCSSAALWGVAASRKGLAAGGGHGGGFPSRLGSSWRDWCICCCAPRGRPWGRQHGWGDGGVSLAPRHPSWPPGSRPPARRSAAHLLVWLLPAPGRHAPLSLHPLLLRQQPLGDAERGSAPAAVAGASPAVCGWPRRGPASRPPAGPSHLSRVNSRFTGTLPRQPSPAGRRWSLPTAREPARGRGEHADPQRTLCSPAAGRSGTAGSVGTAGSAWPPAGGRGAG